MDAGADTDDGDGDDAAGGQEARSLVLSARLDVLSRDLDRARRARDQLAIELASVKLEASRGADERAALRASLTNEREEVAKLGAAVRASDRAAALARADRESADAAGARLIEQLRLGEARLAKLEADLASARSEGQRVRDELDGRTAALAAEARAHAQTQQRLDAAEANTTSARTALVEARAAIATFKARARALAARSARAARAPCARVGAAGHRAVALPLASRRAGALRVPLGSIVWLRPLAL